MVLFPWLCTREWVCPLTEFYYIESVKFLDLHCVGLNISLNLGKLGLESYDAYVALGSTQS